VVRCSDSCSFVFVDGGHLFLVGTAAAAAYDLQKRKLLTTAHNIFVPNIHTYTHFTLSFILQSTYYYKLLYASV